MRRLLVALCCVARGAGQQADWDAVSRCVPPVLQGAAGTPSSAGGEKIFFIGLHKTGTTTYNRLCKAAGIKSAHSTKWLRYIKTQSEYDCFSDMQDAGGHGEIFDGIRNLTHRWPTARFVLNTRPLLDWVVSVLDHTTAANKRCSCSKFAQSETKQEREQLGTPAYVNAIVRRRAVHHSQILSFFGSSQQLASRFMIADVTTQPPEEIASALAALFGRPSRASSLLQVLNHSEAGHGHISSYHDAQASFMELTLHVGNEAQALAALRDYLPPAATHESNGVRGCPDKLLAM